MGDQAPPDYFSGGNYDSDSDRSLEDDYRLRSESEHRRLSTDNRRSSFASSNRRSLISYLSWHSRHAVLSVGSSTASSNVDAFQKAPNGGTPTSPSSKKAARLSKVDSVDTLGSNPTKQPASTR